MRFKKNFFPWKIDEVSFNISLFDTIEWFCFLNFYYFSRYATRDVSLNQLLRILKFDKLSPRKFRKLLSQLVSSSSSSFFSRRSSRSTSYSLFLSFNNLSRNFSPGEKITKLLSNFHTFPHVLQRETPITCCRKDLTQSFY